MTFSRSQSSGNTNRAQDSCFPASRFGILAIMLDCVGLEGSKDLTLLKSEREDNSLNKKFESNAFMKILAVPHLLQHLWTWLGKLESSCSEACPGVPPCLSPLLFLVDYKCIPDPQTCNTTEKGEYRWTSGNSRHSVMTHPQIDKRSPVSEFFHGGQLQTK